MFELDKKDSLNLYLYLSEKDDLSIVLNNILNELEGSVYELCSVQEIESFRLEFKDKGFI